MYGSSSQLTPSHYAEEEIARVEALHLEVARIGVGKERRATASKNEGA